MTRPDLDAALLQDFTVNDGILGLACIDDDRPLALWSHYHAERCTTQLAIARARVRIAEWTLADVAPRGDARCTAAAEARLAAVREELASWEHRRDLLEAARRADSYAPRVSPFTE
jgi:hypothetical protein